MRDAELTRATGTWTCEDVPWAGELAGPAVAAWRQVLAATPGALAPWHPEWLAMAREAGLVRPWRALIVRHNDEPVGILPLCRPAPWRVEVPSPLAPDVPPALLPRGGEVAAWGAVARWLRAHPAVRVLNIGRVDDARAEACNGGAGLAAVARPCAPRMVIAISDVWEDYVAGLQAEERRNIRKGVRQFLEETPGAAFEVRTDVAGCADLIERLIAIHRDRWPNSVLKAEPVAQFCREAMAWAVECGLACIACLRHEDRVMATQVMLHAPGSDTVHANLFARDQQAAHPRCPSPGHLLNALTVRWAREQGFSRYDLSFGNAGSKRQVGAAPESLYELELARTAGEAAVLHAGRVAWARARRRRAA